MVYAKVTNSTDHMGARKTIGRISELFLWNGIVEDVKVMVCQLDIYRYTSIDI